MKSKFIKGILLVLIIHFSLLFPESCRSVSGRENVPVSLKPHKLMYMIMIADARQEAEAEVLIKSIRDFGGEYSYEPVVLVISNTNESLGKSLTGKADMIVNLEMDEILRSFYFSDKVFACGQVEEMVKDSTDWLLWLNPDAIVFEPPDEIVGPEEKWVSIRPVHVKNVGSDFNGAINTYWRKIYQKTGVDTTAFWPVESFVDNQRLRPYFNSGCMAFRPSAGILREWKKLFREMLYDKQLYDYYTSESNSQIFFHQALLSSIIIAKAGKERINILPPAYSYPLVQQNVKGFVNRIDSVPGISIVLTGVHENIALLKASEPYKSWIRMNVKTKSADL